MLGVPRDTAISAWKQEKEMITGVLTFFSGLFYRLGGLGDDGKKLLPFLPEWAFDEQVRRIGCMLCGLAYMLLHGYGIKAIVPHVLAAGAFYGLITTYWDFITGEDNFYLHGFSVGFAYIPYAVHTTIYGGNVWGMFILRCLALAGVMGGLNAFLHSQFAKRKLPKKILKYRDWIEEIARGAAIVLSLKVFA